MPFRTAICHPINLKSSNQSVLFCTTKDDRLQLLICWLCRVQFSTAAVHAAEEQREAASKEAKRQELFPSLSSSSTPTRPAQATGESPQSVIPNQSFPISHPQSVTPNQSFPMSHEPAWLWSASSAHLRSLLRKSLTNFLSSKCLIATVSFGIRSLLCNSLIMMFVVECNVQP